MSNVNIIRQWREKRGLKVRELAEAVGVKDSAVSKWERGSVGIRSVQEVSNFTGIPLHVLRPDIYPTPEAANDPA